MSVCYSILGIPARVFDMGGGGCNAPLYGGVGVNVRLDVLVWSGMRFSTFSQSFSCESCLS